MIKQFAKPGMAAKAGMCLIVILSMLGITACGEAMPYSEYDVSEYIKVGQYKGLSVDAYTIKVTKKEIKEKIQENLEAAKSDNKLPEGTKVIKGDTVNIDYSGTVDGKEFDGGSSENYDLELGSGTFIEGFEDGLIGKTVGQKNIKLNLTFPDDYSADEVAGKDVVFTVTINSATRTPEYDLDFVKSQGDYTSKKEYEAAVKKEIYNEKKEEAENEQKTELWDQVVSNSEIIKYPKEEVTSYMEVNSAQIDSYAEQYNVDRADILSQYGFSDEDDFKKQNKESSRLRVKQELIIIYIADKEGLTYSDDEKEEMLNNFEQQGYDEDAIQQYTGRTADEYAHIQLLYEKVLDFLLDNAVITE